MQPLTAAFTAAHATSHVVAARVDLIRAGAVVQRVDTLATDTTDRRILDGSVSINRTGGARRSASVSLVNPPVTLTAYGDRFKLWRGVRYPDGTTEYAALGLFIVTQVTRELQGGRTVVTVEGEDLSRLVARRRWARPYVVAAGTLFTDAVPAIIEDRLPGTATRIVASPLRTTVPVLFDGANEDPWQAVERLAAACGRDPWFDPHGTFMLTPPPSNADPVVHTVTDGRNGTIGRTSRREDSDPGPNGVIVVSENPGAGPDIWAEAWDDDPASPTWRHGPYGAQPTYIGSPLVHTIEQARQVAAVELAKLTVASVTLELTAAPHPGLEAGDRVRVVRRADALDEVIVADTITMPLLTGDMRLGAEQPVQAVARTIATLGGGGRRVRRIARRYRADSSGDTSGGEITGDPVDLPAAEPPDSTPIDPAGIPEPAYDPGPDPIDPNDIEPFSIPVIALEAPVIVPPGHDIETPDFDSDPDAGGWRLPSVPDLPASTNPTGASSPVRLPNLVVGGSAAFRNRIYFEDVGAASNEQTAGYIGVDLTDPRKLEIVNPDGSAYSSGSGSGPVAFLEFESTPVAANEYTHMWFDVTARTITSLSLSIYNPSNDDITVTFYCDSGTIGSVTLPSGDVVVTSTVSYALAAGEQLGAVVDYCDGSTGSGLTAIARLT